MKALTLHQPWANLIAEGIKFSETRNWKPPARLIGQRIAIHAAKRWNKQEVEMLWNYYEQLDFEDMPPLGAIVCTARLVAVARVRGTEWLEIMDGVEQEFLVGDFLYVAEGYEDRPAIQPVDDYGDYTPRRYVWALVDITRLTVPKPCRGYQGLWNVPDDIARQISPYWVARNMGIR